MSVATASAPARLLAELAWLDAALEGEIGRMRSRRLLGDDAEYRGLYVSDEHVEALLGSAADDEPLPPPEADGDDTYPLDVLAHRFELTQLERAALLVALAPEIDLRFATLFSYAQNDVTRRRPTVDLILRLLCGSAEERLAQRAAFEPGGRLLTRRLVTVVGDALEPLPARSVVVEDRVAAFALGHDGLDQRLLASARLRDRAADADPEALGRARAVLDASVGRPCLVLLRGGYGAGKEDTAAAASAAAGMRLLVADLAAISPDTLPETLELLARDATLEGAALYLANAGQVLEAEDRSADLRTIVAYAGRLPVPLFLGADAEWHPAGYRFGGTFASITLPEPAAPARARLWREALAVAGAGGADSDLNAVAATFRLTSGQIADAAQEAVAQAAIDGVESVALERLTAAARANSGRSLARLAQKVELLYGWEDIVLPPRQLRELRELCSSVRHRSRVHDTWGFARRLALGGGLQVLFSGPSGTGKTMAAEIVAHDVSLDLYKIDLSTVVSKYIGETEQRLSRIFAAARASNAVLFFDEADALFGQRSEVKDAHDRYANIEVAYLLQKVEEYDGIVVLATNLSRNIDEAFARRLHHAIRFPFPDASLRRRIWSVVLPLELPLAADVDLDFLAARFELAGGNIKNVAVAAAYLAADDDGPVAMEHFIRATAREYQKLGRLPAKADFGEHWAFVAAEG